MKTTVLLTILLSAMFYQITTAQQTNDVCEFEKVLTLSINSETVGGVVFVDSSKTYLFEPGLTVVFKTERDFSHEGRLKAFNTNIDCIIYSKENPESGWAMIIPEEDLSIYRSGLKTEKLATLQSIRFIDQKNGWAAGKLEMEGIETGVIFYTDDGGQNWMVQYLGGTAMRLNTACFTNHDIGTVSGMRMIGQDNFNIVLYTEDGGLTWEEYNSDMFTGQF